ncbi:hypothetical protein AB6A40_005943 [Gnathostoma spinigerum]|uniref:Serine/threonine-protein kinase receptor n=1 Tax=Gnathostoma spinigerum TaxID=75299 RepID=A0ABD6EPK4_9BILA
MSRIFIVFLIAALPVLNKAANDTDPGLFILEYLKKYESSVYVDGPVSLEEDLICNCTRHGCDTEIVNMLGEQHRGLCRSRGGMCFKQTMRLNDGEIATVLGCFSKDASPDMFCSSRQLLPQYRVLSCCNDQSFCNVNLNTTLSPLIEQLREGLPVQVLLLVGTVVASVFCFFGMVIGFTWMRNKRGKKSFLPLLLRRHPPIVLNGQGTTDMLLAATPPSKDSGYIHGLLGNLDNSCTSGSGSGLPLLVQRTIARQIELRTEIGQGRFGEVWLGVWKGEPVAVKIFSSRDTSSWSREVEVYQTNMLRHPNVLRFIASDNKDTGMSTQLWLITEYHVNGSLFDYLSDNTVSAQTMYQMIRSVANGLAFLHSEIPGEPFKPAIAHRDLKSKNVLVKSDLTCVIADLGLAVSYTNGKLSLPDNNKCGTIRYLSPECLDNSFAIYHFDAYKMSDIYAFGLIIWEIARRCAVGGAESFEQAYFEFVPRDPSIQDMRRCVCEEKHRPTISSRFLSTEAMYEVSRIMRECWSESPSARLTAMNVRIFADRFADSAGWNIRKY